MPFARWPADGIRADAAFHASLASFGRWALRGNARTAVAVVALAMVGVAGCRVAPDQPTTGARGRADPAASSFAFFGGLRAFFVDEGTAQTVRPVDDSDLTRTEDAAPVQSAVR